MIHTKNKYEPKVLKNYFKRDNFEIVAMYPRIFRTILLFMFKLFFFKLFQINMHFSPRICLRTRTVLKNNRIVLDGAVLDRTVVEHIPSNLSRTL